MKKATIILAEGFEELEAVTVIDVLRRGGVEVVIAGLKERPITGAHQIQLHADCLLTEIDPQNLDAIILPGGLPGSEHLAKSVELQSVLKAFDQKGKLIAAICAAPWALATANVLKSHYTCYPGFEKTVLKPGYETDKNVVICKNVITSRGPATAMEFALAILANLVGDEIATKVKNGLLF